MGWKKHLGCAWLSAGSHTGECRLKADLESTHAFESPSQHIACGLGWKTLLYTLSFHLKSPSVQGALWSSWLGFFPVSPRSEIFIVNAKLTAVTALISYKIKIWLEIECVLGCYSILVENYDTKCLHLIIWMLPVASVFWKRCSHMYPNIAMKLTFEEIQRYWEWQNKQLIVVKTFSLSW